MLNTYHVAGVSKRQVQNVPKCSKIWKLGNCMTMESPLEKCIQISTNMPGIASLICEIHVKISQIWAGKILLFSKTNARLLLGLIANTHFDSCWSLLASNSCWLPITACSTCLVWLTSAPTAVRSSDTFSSARLRRAPSWPMRSLLARMFSVSCWRPWRSAWRVSSVDRCACFNSPVWGHKG